ncbi:hypothetical protein ACWFRJ_30740 [Streptomyces sp. NPDC055239]
MTQPHVWPRASDYMGAVQTPSICFADARLREAMIHTDAMGMPLAASGKSAVVFKATAGAKDIAIRCFTRAASDQRLRYQALHEYLGPVLPPHLVGFAYRDREIVVEGVHYPLVEMDWVDGDPLDVWVGRRLGQRSALGDQAATWLTAVNDMLNRGMAHGDIANDNCLVSGSQMKLIDYDGCFIPELADRPPGESGAQHFQHPSRRNGYYAGDMDAFPSLVVFLSLLALQNDASLWGRFHTDKNLIFHDTDFQQPGRTAIWRELTRINDTRVGELAAALTAMCRAPITQLPSLPQVTARAGIQVTGQPPWKLVGEPGPAIPRPWPEPPRYPPPAAAANPSFDWIADHVGPDGRRAENRPPPEPVPNADATEPDRTAADPPFGGWPPVAIAVAIIVLIFIVVLALA